MCTGTQAPNPRRLQLASAPGFLARAVACLSSANDATAAAAAGVLGMLSTCTPEACALILQQGGAVQALLTLVDGRRSGARCARELLSVCAWGAGSQQAAAWPSADAPWFVRTPSFPAAFLASQP
jgi:hypothetical protein